MLWVWVSAFCFGFDPELQALNKPNAAVVPNLIEEEGSTKG